MARDTYPVKNNLRLYLAADAINKMTLADAFPSTKKADASVPVSQRERNTNSDGVPLWQCSVLVFPKDGKPQLLPVKVPCSGDLTAKIGEDLPCAGAWCSTGIIEETGKPYFSISVPEVTLTAKK